MGDRDSNLGGKVVAESRENIPRAHSLGVFRAAEVKKLNRLGTVYGYTQGLRPWAKPKEMSWYQRQLGDTTNCSRRG